MLYYFMDKIRKLFYLYESKGRFLPLRYNADGACSYKHACQKYPWLISSLLLAKNPKNPIYGFHCSHPVLCLASCSVCYQKSARTNALTFNSLIT